MHKPGNLIELTRDPFDNELKSWSQDHAADKKSVCVDGVHVDWKTVSHILGPQKQ